MRTAAAAGLLALATAVTGCGSATRGASPSTTTLSPTVLADRTVAEQALLRQSDLPPGWTTAPPEGSPTDPDLQRLRAECLQLDPSAPGEGARTVNGPDFELRQTQQKVQDWVEVLSTSADAHQRFAALDRPEAAACLSSAMGEVIRKGLANPGPEERVPSGVSFGDVSTQRISYPTVGDATVAYRVALPLEAAGERSTVYTDFVVAIKGRARTMLAFLSLGSPFPSDLAAQLTQAVVERLPPA
jgi:hypothetical protein